MWQSAVPSVKTVAALIAADQRKASAHLSPDESRHTNPEEAASPAQQR